MTAVRIPTAMKVDTNPTVQPSLSIKRLLHIIFAAPRLPLPKRTRGAPLLSSCDSPFTRCSGLITRVCAYSMELLDSRINAYCTYIVRVLPIVLRALAPVNISGRYRDSVQPGPGGIGAPVFCCLSIRDTALKEICRALRLNVHLSASPVALSCKAQPATSHLLY
jgi:hypothetical protein